MHAGGGKDDFSHEINIIPLVDIMLVLLIIFMITAPFIKASVKLELPETRTLPALGEEKGITVRINSKSEIFVEEKKVKLDELVKFLEGFDKNLHVFVEADRKVRWEVVAKVIDKINEAGFRKIGLVTFSR